MFKINIKLIIIVSILYLFIGCTKEQRKDLNIITREAQKEFDILSDKQAESITLYNKAMEIEGDYDYTLNRKLNLLSDAIKLDEINFEAYFARGWIHHLLGNNIDGIKDYNIYIKSMSFKKFKGVSKAYCNRGIIHWDEGNISQSMIDFNNAITEANDDYNMGRAYYHRGKLKYINGDKEEACEDWSLAGGYGFTDAYEKMRDLCNE